jgi:hypothetical protein
MIRALIGAALLTLCHTGRVEAQFVPNPGNPYNPIIAGVPVYCTSFGSGQPVAFVPNPSLQDIGRALPAMPGLPPRIELNPVYLAQLPSKLQLFWYGHECGHHVLGPMNSETNADCWSIRTGKAQGLFTRQDVASFAPYFANNPGSPWGHLPGPIRTQVFLACFDRA